MSNDNQSKSSWSEVPLSDQFTWTDATSSNGQPFKIGTPKATTTSNSTVEGTPADKFLAATSETPFDIRVDWSGGPAPPGFADFKKPTSEETATTSITSYNLTTGWLSYNEFAFTCTKAYHFYFYDKTGDCYENNVIWPRDGTSHTIIYFSRDPTIVRVVGN